MSATLAHITEAENYGGLPAQHHVCGAHDSVHARVAATVQIIEFALGYRVIHIDRRE